eukprot:CAMPEP_0202958066 /NCGR_PEP_ID=MMETSP1396-20130829/2409_1 /ASSEMBLY_ACC=CAM_ASM_000872 /TAXON_ID= /ORGANISM="Pseudokeronopsis sp., Strain Brazil" /LENGTH=152 /DNA_ID=CAMNT_0049675895 /DNA_START=31 /DNA_END=489 /DNA_ORIENTATION=-
MNQVMSNDIYDSLLSGSPQRKETSSKKVFLGVMASLVVAVCLFQAFSSNVSVAVPEETAMSLHSWERIDVDCSKCPLGPVQIISVAFGDMVITGDFIQRYNEGVRSFTASNEFWGINAWPDVRKKSFVVTFIMCNNFHTKVITEGQTLIFPE